jgi:hypothetical protein
VNVTVDQARQHEAALRIDLDVGVTGVRVGDIDDDAVFDHHGVVLGIGHRCCVENHPVPDDGAFR